jgi:DNA repair exonuclease SbcCD ATPase subunit
MQGLIETEDGKVFELDSPKGSAWLESIGSFRFEPAGDGKPYTVRKEASGYWYGCRKVAGKVRKKYIGKSSEVNTAKLEKIAAALGIPPAQRLNKVAEVAQEVTQDTRVADKVAEVAEDRLTALELEVANLRKALEALQEPLPGKLESGDSAELPKVDNAVAGKLHNELSNLEAEPEDIEFLKRLLAKKSPLISSDLWQEIERLKERNRLLRIKSREERQKLEEKISVLEYRDKSQSQRLQEKQARLDELEAQLEQERADRKEVETKVAAELKSAQVTIAAQRDKIHNLERGYGHKPTHTEGILRRQLGELQAELSHLKHKIVTASELPEAAEILNQLKAKRKKSSATLADVEKIIEILEASSEN